jgi:hypothetical protein
MHKQRILVGSLPACKEKRLREIGFLLALVVGLVAGLFLSFPFGMAEVGIYHILQGVLHLPETADALLIFSLGLYLIWFLGLCAITRSVGRLNFILLVLFVLPLPSIAIFYQWGKDLDRRWGHRSDLAAGLHVAASGPVEGCVRGFGSSVCKA